MQEKHMVWRMPRMGMDRSVVWTGLVAVEMEKANGSETYLGGKVDRMY